MSALTTLVNRVSCHSARRGVLFQLQPILALAKNGDNLHAIRTKSFHSASRPSITEQFKKNMPWVGKLYGIMFATATGSIYITGWVYDQAEKKDTLARERHIKELSLAIEETALEEERTLKQIALAKAETTLVKDRTKKEASLAIKEIALVEERAKKEIALVEERAKKEIALAKAETTLVKERAKTETALWKERTEKMIANAKAETAETFLRYGFAAEFFEYQKKLKLGDHGKAESDEKE